MIEENIGLLDRIRVPHLKLMRAFFIGKGSSLILAERRGKRSLLYVSNMDGYSIQPLSSEDARAICGVLTSNDPGPGAPVGLMDSMHGYSGISISVAERIDVIVDPQKPGNFALAFRGPGGRSIYDLTVHDADNFVAAVNTLLGE